jgi:hypothetical protein
MYFTLDSIYLVKNFKLFFFFFSSHWWINDGYPETCLEEAEYLASLTPVRLGENGLSI